MGRRAHRVGVLMAWAAYFQADGDMRHTIAVKRFEHTAAFERDEFVKRMTHPEVGVWFTWLEEVADEEQDRAEPC